VTQQLRQGTYRLTLSIGLSTERTEELDINELVEDWEALADEEFDLALHAAWKEWAWEFIDGGAERIDHQPTNRRIKK
jgi:hypothetical protein